jgi:SAM-dependent methyltransferase
MRTLRQIFNDWGQRVRGAYIHKQWLLSKWEVLDGIEWPPDKVELLFNNIRQNLRLESSNSLVDLGCGGGWIRSGLKSHVKSAVGLDISLEMLKNAQMTSQDENHFLCGDICSLPIKTESFDRALCYFVFVNFGDPDAIVRAIREIMRVLKKGGRALIGQIPDRDYSAKYDAAKADYLDYCRKNFQVGKSIRDICLVPVHPFDRKFFTDLLNREGIAYQMYNSFNPFYRPGEPETVDWRFDLLLEKK